MPRPCKDRKICVAPRAVYFKPRGIPLTGLEEIGLAIDEVEAMRLADLEGLYQEAAAARMGISRQTFGNTIASAHRKVAEAIIRGKALRIDGAAGKGRGRPDITRRRDAKGL